MENNEVIEGNKLIAEFMEIEWNTFEQLKRNYDSNWNELMPVVQKIEDLRFDTRILRAGTETEYTMCEITDVLNNEIAIQSHQNKITAVYNTVVEFIKWYKTTNLK